VKTAAEEAAIVGASSEAGKKVPQLTQQEWQKRAPQRQPKERPQSSQKEHPLEQPRPLE